MIKTQSNAPIVCMFACLSDNYGYLIHDPASHETICIDSPDANKILETAESNGWNITQIWNTHWHADHAGGNEAIQKATECTILGPEEVKSRLQAPIDTILEGGEKIQLGEHDVQVIATPGHTLGHICYYIPSISSAFVGDTLFSLGCGRMFEGQPDMFWNSLQKIRALPDETKIYCAHEYTLSNLEFAESIDRNNEDLSKYGANIRQLRNDNKPTIPAILGIEKRCNPFLNADSEVLKTAVNMQPADASDSFAAIRKLKDNF